MTECQRFFGAMGVGLWLAVLILGSGGPSVAAADESTTQIEVELTESFYRALSSEGGKTYSTSKSEEYLRQIAVSSRFTVESNLKILKQQERIIELLEGIKKKGK